jgi:hypothetical protein
MPRVVRQGDKNSAGGRVIKGDKSFLKNIAMLKQQKVLHVL